MTTGPPPESRPSAGRTGAARLTVVGVAAHD
jgi:hypothetical protein